ncbi:hypothetical protein ACHAPT_006470 [Fusarium lateritium]
MAQSAGPPVPPVEREGITVLSGNENSEVEFFWPWELQNKVKNARVMVFGYNADVTSAFADNLIRIRDIGRMLLSDLVVERQEDEAILLASKELHNQESDKRLIYTSTRGLFFFGTPHLGSRAGEATRVAVLKAIAKTAFVKVPPKLDWALKLHSDELNDLTDDFRRTSLWLDQKFIIYSYYESVETGSLNDIVVDQASALTGYDKENPQPVQRNHQDMVKFADEKDRVFRNVCGNIKAVMRATSSKVPANAKVPSYPAFSMEPVKNFVPRKALLNQVRSQLTCEPEGRQMGVRKVGIWGSGGTGKSQLARAYLQQYGNQYDATFWVHAIGPATLERGFQDIYNALPGPTSLPPNASTENARAAVLMWFFQNPGKWLLVFDEADDLDEKDENFIQLSNYIPRGNNVHVIITSRSSTARDFSTYDGVEIRTLEPTEAVNLFLACAKIEGATQDASEQAEFIADELDYLPLALTIAGSYVSRTPRLAADLSQYLKEHQERRELLRQEPQQLIDMYGRSLMSTWEASYTAVHNQLPDACCIFTLLGFFGKDDIHIDLFPWVSPQEEEGHDSWRFNLDLKVNGVSDLEKCFSILEQYCMIQRDATKGGYSMHSLVHAWSLSRLETKQPEHLDLYAGSASLVLVNSTGKMLKALEISDTENNRQAALRLVPHLRNGLQILKKNFANSNDRDGKEVAEQLLPILVLMQQNTSDFRETYTSFIAERFEIDQIIESLGREIRAAQGGRLLPLRRRAHEAALQARSYVEPLMSSGFVILETMEHMMTNKDIKFCSECRVVTIDMLESLDRAISRHSSDIAGLKEALNNWVSLYREYERNWEDMMTLVQEIKDQANEKSA